MGNYWRIHISAMLADNGTIAVHANRGLSVDLSRRYNLIIATTACVGRKASADVVAALVLLMRGDGYGVRSVLPDVLASREVIP